MGTKLTNDNINYAIFISQVMACMNCARILKTIIPDGNPTNQTYRELGNSLQQTIILNAYKIWDKNSYNIKNLLVDFSNPDVTAIALEEYEKLERKYDSIIGEIKPWRNKIVAHLDKTDLERFQNLSGEISQIQKMVDEVSSLINKHTNQSEKLRFISYDDIESTLFNQ